MFPLMGPQSGGGQPPTNFMNSQGIGLLGKQPFMPTQQPLNFNTTAPQSTLDPSTANMVKALQGGMQ